MKKELITLTVVLLAAGAFATPKQFKKMDTDQDGFVSRAEYIAANKIKKPDLSETTINSWFDKRDKNKDDKLTGEEFDSIKPRNKKSPPVIG